METAVLCMQSSLVHLYISMWRRYIFMHPHMQTDLCIEDKNAENYVKGSSQLCLTGNSSDLAHLGTNFLPAVFLTRVLNPPTFTFWDFINIFRVFKCSAVFPHSSKLNKITWFISTLSNEFSHNFYSLTPMHEHKAALSGMHWLSGRCLFVIRIQENPLYPLEIINREMSPRVFALLKELYFQLLSLGPSLTPQYLFKQITQEVQCFLMGNEGYQWTSSWLVKTVSRFLGFGRKKKKQSPLFII